MTIVAFDSKEFIRGGKEKSFFAPLGVGVKFSDKADFKNKYDSLLNEIAPKFQLRRERKVYKTYELIRKFGLPKTIAFLESFLEKASGMVNQMAVYYTIIPPTKVPRVRKHGVEGYPVKEVDVLKYLAELNPAYVHCCAWRYAKLARPSETLLLDGFEFKITDAWKELERMGKEHLRIYPHGDQCNPFISVADMMVAIVDFRLYRNKKKLDPLGIESVFSDVEFDVFPNFIGQPDFPKIVPGPDRMIDATGYFARPIIFIVLEETELIRKRAARKMFESSPLMDSVLNKAFELDAAVLFFDPEIHSNAIRNGDKFLCVGPKAKEAVRYVQEMYDVEILTRENFELSK